MRIEIEDGGKLNFFQGLYEEALATQKEDFETLDRHVKQYRGSKKIDGSEVEADVVRNITYELIESQVTSYLPNPSVHPKMISDRKEINAKAIETMLANKRDELPFEKMNDMDERFCPIYGGSVWLIEWDNSIVTHNTVGDVRVTCIAPTHFVGQPNIYEIQDMEYCFVRFETTKEDIVRKYGVELKLAEEAESDESVNDRTATLIVCYYKDADDKICEYAWSGETELLDIEDYYARKRYKCKKCGRRKEICECEKPAFELMNEEFEEPERDIPLSDGSVIPAQNEVIKDGQVVMEEVQKPVTAENGSDVFGFDPASGLTLPEFETVLQPKTEQTKLPFFTPNLFPIVIRKNTSQEDSLLGQSDCEFVRPQQQAINKLESRIMQKVMRSTVKTMVPDTYRGDVDNGIFEDVLKCKPNEVNQFGRIDTQVDISRDVMEADRMYDHAKRILGITDSYQGQYDASAKSGRAKQIQVQQAAGRLDSKRQMKNAAYAEIDAIIFQYFLAYADEPRPAVYRDAQGRLQNVQFNRYDFLERDETGKWYYDDEYLFSCDASVDVDRDRETLWQENRLNFQQGAYGDVTLPETQLIFWQNMERAHYPWAHDNVERIRIEIERRAQMAQYEQQIAQLKAQIKDRAGYENELAKRLASASGTVSGGVE